MPFDVRVAENGGVVLPQPVLNKIAQAQALYQHCATSPVSVDEFLGSRRLEAQHEERGLPICAQRRNHLKTDTL